MDDLQLLRQYIKDGSQDAFASIVAGHVDLVYGTARRLVGDEHLAQDVAQAVFVVLARRAKQVEPGRLAGWLVNATRLAANEARRAKLCREKHEWRAAQMRSSNRSEEADEPTLEQLTPLLDEALCRLGEADRTAVAMRFLQGRSFAEVAAAMGSSEEAARKRVERAVEKLRGTFMKKGFAPSVGGLMVVLAAHQAQAAPAGLAGSISATAISGGAGTGAILAKGAMKMMTMAKVKVAAVIVLAVVTAAAVGSGIVAAASGPASSSPAVAALEQGVQVLLPDGTPAAGAEVYLPKPGENVMFVNEPFASLGQRGPTSRPAAALVLPADGRLSLTRDQQQLPILAIVHAEGVLDVAPGELGAGPVSLHSWGRLQGQLSPALRTGPGQRVRAGATHMTMDGFQLIYDYSAPGAEDGSFGFDHLPPGPCLVARVFTLSRGRTEMGTGDHGSSVMIESGKVANTTLGGSGRGLHARVVPPAGSTWKLADTFAYVELIPMDQRAPGSGHIPAEFQKWNGEQRKSWLRGFAKTAEGKAYAAEYEQYRAGLRGKVANWIGSDGSIDLAEVPPGTYRMMAYVYTVNSGPAWGLGKPLAHLERDVVVPDAGQKDPVDLGTLTLEGIKLAPYTVQNEVTGKVDKVGETGGQVQRVPDEPARTSLATIRALLDGIKLYALEHKLGFPDKLDDLAKYLGPALPRLLINPDRPNQHPGYIYLKPTGQFDKIDPGLVLLYEAFDAWPTGGVAAGFADGHCEKINDEATFRRLLEASEAKP